LLPPAQSAATLLPGRTRPIASAQPTLTPPSQRPRPGDASPAPGHITPHGGGTSHAGARPALVLHPGQRILTAVRRLVGLFLGALGGTGSQQRVAALAAHLLLLGVGHRHGGDEALGVAVL